MHIYTCVDKFVGGFWIFCCNFVDLEFFLSMAIDEETPLVLENPKNQNPIVNHERDVYIMSSAFLLIFLAYGAAQNLESTINTVWFLSIVLFNEVYGVI